MYTRKNIKMRYGLILPPAGLFVIVTAAVGFAIRLRNCLLHSLRLFETFAQDKVSKSTPSENRRQSPWSFLVLVILPCEVALVEALE